MILSWGFFIINFFFLFRKDYVSLKLLGKNKTVTVLDIFETSKYLVAQPQLLKTKVVPPTSNKQTKKCVNGSRGK